MLPGINTALSGVVVWPFLSTGSLFCLALWNMLSGNGFEHVDEVILRAARLEHVYLDG